MKNLTVTAFVAAMVLLICSSAVRNASALDTVLKVEGPLTVDPSVSETFTVSVIIENVPSPGFFGWEFFLSWDPDVFNCTSETLNTGIWPSYMTWVSSPIDNAAGTYHQSMTATNPSQPQIGTFWLVNLTYRIITTTPVATEITLSPPEGCEYCIADKQANEIPHDYQDLPINVVPEFETAILAIMMLLSSTAVISAKKLKRHETAQPIN